MRLIVVLLLIYLLLAAIGSCDINDAFNSSPRKEKHTFAPDHEPHFPLVDRIASGGRSLPLVLAFDPVSSGRSSPIQHGAHYSADPPDDQPGHAAGGHCPSS